MKNTIFLLGILFLAISFASCNKEKEFITQTEILKVDSYNNTKKIGYTNQGIKESVIESYSSDDNLCKINKMKSYYEVWLDYEKGTPEQVGKAYVSTLLSIFPEYEKILEPYLYENIHIMLGNMNINYESLYERTEALFESLPEDYKRENKSFAETISNGEKGFFENGKISYEEGLLLQMIPDALRGTACSALSLWGEKTVSGKNIICRNLEWLLGSEKQLCNYHAVVHMNKGKKNITSITVLGLNGIISAINSDGVFAAILDVGSEGENFVYKNKKCYTYELRKALENYDSGEKVGKFMVESTPNFTYSHNIVLADPFETCCAEDAVESLQKTGKGKAILRKAETPIFDGLIWENKDTFFVLNSFAAKGNQDFFSGNEGNYVRLVKMNNGLKSQEKFSIADLKELFTQEIVDQQEVVNIHSKGSFQTIIVDYESGEIQVAFTGTEGVLDKPEFINIGHY